MSAASLVSGSVQPHVLTHRTVSTFSSSPSFFALPTNRCLSFVLQPSIVMNWSNSSTLRLQQLYPLLPSWKIGTPGWCTHFSPSLLPPLNVSPQPFLLQVMPSFGGVFGSSSSDSGAGAGVVARGVAWAAGRRGAGAGSDSCSDPRLTEVPLGTSGVSTFSGAGVSSTSECFPLVQGSIARNSSNVRTRGLQHFQPESACQLERSE